METFKQATCETVTTLLRNRYVLCALVALGTIGPGIVKLTSMLQSIKK